MKSNHSSDGAEDSRQRVSEEREPEGHRKPDKEDSENDQKKPKKPPIYRKPAFIITASIVALVLVVGGIIFRLIARQYVSTNDAYIDGHVTQISPRVSALTLTLRINDNQLVHKGDLLLELDPTDYQLALDQATAEAAFFMVLMFGSLVAAACTLFLKKMDLGRAPAH